MRYDSWKSRHCNTRIFCHWDNQGDGILFFNVGCYWFVVQKKICVDLMSLFYENSFDSCVIFNIIIQQWFYLGMVGFTMLLKTLVVVFFYLVFYYSFIPLVSSSDRYCIQNSRVDFEYVFNYSLILVVPLHYT